MARRKTIKCKCSTSSYDWSTLPKDVWVKIFCRVEAKELVTKKIVCKLWEVSISIDWVREVFVRRLGGFVFKVVNGTYEPSLVNEGRSKNELIRLGPVATCSALLPFIPSLSEFLGYCNGLQLFIRTSSQQYYVCNSATRQCLAIPTCSQVQNFRYSSLTFDPCESLHFKLVCFESVSSSIKYYIFSSDTCRWEMHQVLFEHPSTDHYWRLQSVYSNGVLYHISESKHLICFDVNNFNVCAIDLPVKERTNTSGHTAERGHLYYSGYNDTDIFIWMLKGYRDGGRWILMQKICLRDLDTMKWVFKSPNYLYHPAESRWNLIATGTPNVIVVYCLSKNKVCLCWRMKEDEPMALGECTFWPHRSYYGSISLKHVA